MVYPGRTMVSFSGGASSRSVSAQASIFLAFSLVGLASLDGMTDWDMVGYSERMAMR